MDLQQQTSILEAELAHLTSRIATEGASANAYVQRGMVQFKLSHINASIEDFDRAEQLNPALTPYLWQRGLSYYYAGCYAEGAKQFEVDLQVNGHDVEETVWRFLCMAQLHGHEGRPRSALTRRARPSPGDGDRLPTFCRPL